MRQIRKKSTEKRRNGNFRHFGVKIEKSHTQNRKILTFSVRICRAPYEFLKEPPMALEKATKSYAHPQKSCDPKKPYGPTFIEPLFGALPHPPSRPELTQIPSWERRWGGGL